MNIGLSDRFPNAQAFLQVAVPILTEIAGAENTQAWLATLQDSKTVLPAVDKDRLHGRVENNHRSCFRIVTRAMARYDSIGLTALGVRTQSPDLEFNETVRELMETNFSSPPEILLMQLADSDFAHQISAIGLLYFAIRDGRVSDDQLDRIFDILGKAEFETRFIGKHNLIKLLDTPESYETSVHQHKKIQDFINKGLVENFAKIWMTGDVGKVKAEFMARMGQHLMLEFLDNFVDAETFDEDIETIAASTAVSGYIRNLGSDDPQLRQFAYDILLEAELSAGNLVQIGLVAQGSEEAWMLLQTRHPDLEAKAADVIMQCF